MQLREDRPADCQRLEMLFLAADERGVGLGRQMLECAVRHYGVRELTVNAQTVGFYEHTDLSACTRTEWMKRASDSRCCI